MNRKLWGICLKWGIVLAALLAALEVVRMFARQVDYGSPKMFDLAMIIGYILILYAGVKAFKAEYPKRLSFGKAFLSGLIISFVGSLLFFGYDLFHYQMVEKDGLARKYETALDNFRQVINKDTIHADELVWYLDSVHVMMAEEEARCLAMEEITDTLRSEISKGVEQIDHFFTEKINVQRSLDTGNHYRMSEFPAFARKTMVETMVLYEAHNEGRTSTSYVRDVVTRTNIRMESLNPSDHRFELNKNRVPAYNRIGHYAAVASLMDLLYGMFFSIFVAMYHYRSKRDPDKEANIEAESEVSEETPETPVNEA